MAGQRVPVAAETGRRQPDEDVSDLDPVGAEQLVTLDHTDGEPDRVEGARCHDPGVLGHLPAEQGGPDLTAPLGHPPDQLGHPVRVDRPDGEVVEEEEGLGPLADQVVHAHGHQVDADGVEPADRLGHEGLRADAVRARHQDGLTVAAGLEGEQATEPADVADHLGAQGGADQRADAVDGPLAGPDVDARPGVGGSPASLSGPGWSRVAGMLGTVGAGSGPGSGSAPVTPGRRPPR